MPADMYLKIEGIDGESQDRNHKGEIEILSYSWGVTQTGAAGGGGGGAGKANLQDFHFVHPVDKSSPKLMSSVCQGNHIREATLSLASTHGKSKGDFLKIKLTDILVSSVRPGGSSATDNQAMEAVSLNFVKLEYSYFASDGEVVKGAASASGLL